MAAVLACGPGAVLSHRSAAQHWGLLPRASHEIEVTRRGSFRSRKGIRCHQILLGADEVTIENGIPATSPCRTLFDLASVSTRRRLELAFHEMEVQQMTDRLSLPQLLVRYPGRRGTRVLHELLACREPVGVTQTDLEELFVAFLDAHQIPRPRFNPTLPIRGRLLRPDCMWVEERLIVELDGRAVHRTDRAFESDRQRDRILLAEGWRSTRVTWTQLHEEPAAIAADLRELLRGTAPPPTL
jgi:very-short-patch-repair endonuclease